MWLQLLNTGCMREVCSEEGSKLYSYLLRGPHDTDPQQQHNLLPHHNTATVGPLRQKITIHTQITNMGKII